MSRLFRRPSSKAVHSSRPDDEDRTSALSSLLTPVVTSQTPLSPPTQSPKPPHRRTKSSPGLLTLSQDQLHSRPWLSLVVSERQISWTGGRPPTRKLVKDPGSAGSARPSFSHELSDQASEGDGKEEGKDRGGIGIMRRGVERIRELYRRDRG